MSHAQEGSADPRHACRSQRPAEVGCPGLGQRRVVSCWSFHPLPPGFPPPQSPCPGLPSTSRPGPSPELEPQRNPEVLLENLKGQLFSGSQNLLILSGLKGHKKAFIVHFRAASRELGEAMLPPRPTPQGPTGQHPARATPRAHLPQTVPHPVLGTARVPTCLLPPTSVSQRDGLPHVYRAGASVSLPDSP